MTNQNNNEPSDFLKSVLGKDTQVRDEQADTQAKDTHKDSLSKKIAKNVAESLVAEAKAEVKSSVANGVHELKSAAKKQHAQRLSNAPAELSLAVVGHTNTGKTSLLRTLLRDSGFGEVKNQAATTKHVERISIFDGSTALVDLYDTPGLEDAGGLLDWLEDNTNARADGVERLHTFLADEVADNEFNQEAKVLRQLLSSDVALYVVDSREPVLGKYKDELTVLSWCAKPVMPVFNFIHKVTADQLTNWQAMLSRRNLHVSTSFDTVAFDFSGEMQLWQNLDTLLSNSTISNPALSTALTRLITQRTDEWQQLEETARIEIAHTLLNVAAYKQEINENDDPTPVLAEMQEQVRQLERRLHDKLLELYRFYNSDVAPTQLSLASYQRDPFDPELLKEYGIRTTSGAVAGAIAGLGIDAATFGASLGLGAAIGGIIGGVLSNTQSISDKLSGKQSLYIDPATITLLATRGMDLLTALMQRGHADQSAISLDTHTANTAKNAEKRTVWKAEKLPSELKKARGKTAWCELNSKNATQSHTLREEAAWSLSSKLAG